MRPEFERVQNLLSDTVTLLCKNGLTYDKEMKVQGLLGITLDEKDVFVVHFNELFSQAVAAAVEPPQDSESDSSLDEPIHIPSKNHTDSPSHRASKRSHRDSSVDLVKVKTESDDVILIDPKKEPGAHGISSNEYGPSSKRRLIENPVSIQSPTLPGDNPNYMSTVSRHSENSNTSWDGTQPPNIHISGVSSLGTNSNMPSLEQQSASWDPSQIPPQQLAQNSQNPIPGSDAILYEYAYGQSLNLPALNYTTSKRPRRGLDGEKTARCTVPGCSAAFYHRKHLYRHQREKHGAAHKRPRPGPFSLNDDGSLQMASDMVMAADGESLTTSGGDNLTSSIIKQTDISDNSEHLMAYTGLTDAKTEDKCESNGKSVELSNADDDRDKSFWKVEQVELHDF